jgi:hypothetical protein
MKKAALASLKLNYAKYAPLWEQWCANIFNDLFHDEIQLVNFYIKNDFSPNDDDRLYLSRAQNIQKVSEKLGSNYLAFQDWVVSEFELGLIRLGSKYDWHDFIYTEIEEMPIDNNLKSLLRNFSCSTIREIIDSNSETDFLSPAKFPLVFACAKALQQEIAVP